MTHTATNVLVIEPIRYWVSESAGTPSARPSSVPRASDHDQLAAADDARRHRRQPDLPLLDGEPRRQLARGRRVERRHAVRPCGPTPERSRVDPADRAAAVFLAVVFLAVDLVVFFAARLRVVGPLARFSARSSNPRSGVIDSGSSPRRSVALVSPSVTYGPNRPSLTVTALPDTGSVPSSFSGAADARPRCFGWA